MPRSKYPSYRSHRPARRTKATWKSNIGGALAKATAALTIANTLKDLINVEYKRTLNRYTPVANQTGVFNLLTDVAQGVTESTRNGNSIKGSSLSIKLDAGIASPATTTLLRYMLIYDKVSNGIAPTVTDLLDNSSGIGNVLAPYNNENARSRFQILVDKRITFTAVQNPRYVTSLYQKIRTHQKYLNNTAGQAGALTGHYYLYTVSDQNTNVPPVNCQCTYSFIDN